MTFLCATLREIRAFCRLIGVFTLIGGGLLTARLLFPCWTPARCWRVKQGWARLLLHVLGVRLRAPATPLPAAALIVSNHTSWLDVFVINAVTPTHFVCKYDVRDWPLIGALVSLTGTLYIARGSRAAAARSAGAIAARLGGGDRVAVFPEGTTTHGERLLPFRPALFQAAVDAGVPVQPMALRYEDAQGRPSLAPAYDGEISFWQCLCAIARASGLQARLTFLEPLAPNADRRILAQQAETQIAAELGLVRPLEEYVDRELQDAPEISVLGSRRTEF
ncbi:MAG: 1-acyl-sn-glycerol-3-phosphate acyltransferase [Candidatus Dactylopiibacterium carminicum]|uniref:1-acyl-sn-glycerol-3-phosphate acyltransferase n=1 Tax=Candidatus Dactylopiibacterium carminicum TaxID=857335 RepID=A0A272EVV0_9RHOO|nr:lysophospholipid acyltransferase family protein [Candidatus Dactylopiibacterium carminicum]KAF7599594.1 1-acyl-sn-glycerol-3-phosphate acyltransferase [Candidatus Dactylopiibacterium carminicum]PAS94241.1 MAG: 1-acyl-sn-glycerol-3-phosphate acyltransferase [Candidatus Dactylopiibacterium carminicum]PAS98438.1 MAG: 1-acyl-sn-glycerol-3-phosphate acyltransferase [Candidatus Dactylopiibacterium carminicum]PAS99596.1 MAG: hypothetical protein BSR46_06945 [Candidatus Dactylopiibacterium carminicu